ncbi:hypothetical protein GYB57_13860 [bacterium]|nr:hypothetical protein [bacterium]
MRKYIKLKAKFILLVFVFQVFSPLALFALTSGPAQPEMASFTPNGTTEFVDPFTGDFSYNIPLFDVEGYPVNISYSSGVTMEQEASWVGLGWNLNVGAVNRSVRGIPDDFNGDQINTVTKIKPMKITKFGTGGGVEAFGVGVSGGTTFDYNNYKGFGISINSTISAPILKVGGFGVNASVGLNISSLDGTSVNSSLGLSLGSKSKDHGSFKFGGSAGAGFNTRTGQSTLNFGTTAGYDSNNEKHTKKSEDATPPSTNNADKAQPKSVESKVKSKSGSSASFGASSSFIPAGMNTYTPVSTMKMKSKAFSFSTTIGSEVVTTHPYVRIHGTQTVQYIADNFDYKKSYGYLFAENATPLDLKDFNRDKEVSLNKTINNLSPTNFTYDIFSVSGQGVSGMFRPYRNDFIKVNDPAYTTKDASNYSIGVEVGVGAYARGGSDLNVVQTFAKYEPWPSAVLNLIKPTKNHVGSLFEKVYYKNAGELTESNTDLYDKIGKDRPIMFQVNTSEVTGNIFIDKNRSFYPMDVPKYDLERLPRTNALQLLSAGECEKIYSNGIKSYSGKFYAGSLSIDYIPRVDEVNRKNHHIGEISQINDNGEIYTFGIPAYNLLKEEVSYSINATTKDAKYKGDRVEYSNSQASLSNDQGKDNFYKSTTTPAYAHSYLLTSKQSSDYQDLTGDGISKDDIGNAYQFNYTRKSSAYKWRIPIKGVNFMEGFKSDKLDQKASFTYGVKEQWYLHTIESKNEVAEFYISPRSDAKGVSSRVGELGKEPGDYSYRLDSIALYNKYDRLKNKGNATPIKRIHFSYTYELCNDTENSNYGKLTLKEIRVLNGKSSRGGLSPYKFFYPTNKESGNFEYNPSRMDRWGNYKEAHEKTINAEFPYCNQDKSKSDLWASAWSLDSIVLPSGGSIKIEYESDDYAYVQDKTAMNMNQVVKVGKTNKFEQGGTSLYENNFLFIKNPNPEIFGIDNNSLLKSLLFDDQDKLDEMYFRFLVNIRGGKSEYVSGYVDASNVGVCPDDPNYIYVQLKPISPNSISKASWGYFRENLFDVLYDQPNVRDGAVSSVVKGMVANISDIARIFRGVEADLMVKGVAQYFTPNKSFIRLYSHNKKKVGGGERVKSIVMTDQWSQMTGEGVSATYGQTYDYTIDDKKLGKISSGVATYEPMVGNDENPFRSPDPYVASMSSGHIPAIAAFNEFPLGESFFPSASVGYSQVTIKDFNESIGKSANQVTEKKFYTAKDFPVLVKSNKILIDYKPPSGKTFAFIFNNIYQKSEFAASQGFSIILNDMHGKPKQEETYAYFDEEVGQEIRRSKKVIGGTIYKYRTKFEGNEKRLDHKVPIINSKGVIEEKELGVEFDMVIDSRSSHEKSISTITSLNMDVIIGLFAIPIPIPNGAYNEYHNVDNAKSITITKVIQEYGIVESVTSYTDQYSILLSNELYDGETGGVILTKSKDEFNKEEYIVNMPAYKMQSLSRMNGAYRNLGFESFVKTSGIPGVYMNPGSLKHGDKVLLTDYSGIVGDEGVAWVSIENAANCPDPFRPNPCFTEDSTTVVINCADQYCSDMLLPAPRDKYYNAWKYNKVNFDSILDLTDSMNAYHLKDVYADSINYWSSEGTILKAPPEKSPHDIRSKLCQMLYDGDSSISTFYHAQGKGFLRKTQDMDKWFDRTDPLPFRLIKDSAGIYFRVHGGCLEVVTDDVLRYEKYLQEFQPILVELFYEDTNNKTHIYYHLINTDNKPVISYKTNKYLDPQPKTTNIQPTDCSARYSLIDKEGNILNGKEGWLIKVIRSGNKNLQALTTANIKSLEYPLKTNPITNKFIGFKDTLQEVQYLAMSSEEFNEVDYLINPFSTSTNPFLTGQSGVFKSISSNRFIAVRNQDNLNLSEEGYYDKTPQMHAIQNEYDPCNSEFVYPAMNTEESYGWAKMTTNTKFSHSASAVESVDILNIKNAVQIDLQGKVQAVASNASINQILYEGFENCYAMGSSQDYALGNIKQHYEMIPLKSTNLLLNQNGRKIREYEPMNPCLIVKGIAHTGNYSLFLEGQPPLSSTFTIDYQQNRELPLAGFKESSFNFKENTTQATINDFSSTLSAHRSKFLAENGIQSLACSGSVKDSIEITFEENVSGDSFKPSNSSNDPDKYYFSVWVKDAVPSGTPYAGASPSVLYGSQVFKAKNEIINGWQKIEGVISMDSTKKLIFKGGLWGAFYDDFRIHPVNSNMNSFVYDQINNRQVSKLDENNYATFYRYDEEGVLNKVSKETPNGVITIQETRQSLNQH